MTQSIINQQIATLRDESLEYQYRAIDTRKALKQTEEKFANGGYDHWHVDSYRSLVRSLHRTICEYADKSAAILAKMDKLKAQVVTAAPVKPESAVRVVESSPEPVEEKPSTPGHHYAAKSEGFREGLKASFRAVKPSPEPVKVKTKPESFRAIQEKTVRESPMLVPTKGESWERVYTLAIGKRVYRVSTRENSKYDRYLRIDLVSGRRAKSDKFLDGLRVCSAGQGSRKKCWQGTPEDFRTLRETFPNVRLGK